MLQAIGEVILEIICGLTGNCLLWAFSLGRWKAFERGDGLATFLGVLFWVGIVGIAVLLYQVL